MRTYQTEIPLKKLQSRIDDIKQFAKEEKILLWQDAVSLWHLKCPLTEIELQVMDNLGIMKALLI